MRRFRPFIFLLLILPPNLIFAGKKTTIICQVKNQVSDQITFTQTNGFFKTIEIDSVKKITKNKIVTFQVNLEEPTAIKIIHDFRSFEVYCEPGDETKVFINGENFPYEVYFEGTGQLHNTLLAGFRNNFASPSKKELLGKIYTGTSMDFRKFMDETLLKKWNFIRNYEKAPYNNCSSAFKNYLRSEVNFWYAYFLMRFRDEHSSVVADDNIYMPDSYFSFLDEIIINDESAFSNAYYSKFLNLYSKFRETFPDFSQGLAARQNIVKGKNAKTSVFADKEANSKIALLETNEKMIVLDQITKDKVAILLKIKTRDGVTGWVKANEVELLDLSENINKTPVKINTQNTKITKYINDCLVKIDSLGVYIDPIDSKTISLLRENEKVAVYSEQTNEHYSFYRNKKFYTAPYVKVRNARGIMGWSSTYGLQFGQLKVSNTASKTLISKESETNKFNLDYFFHGKTLEYLFGNRILSEVEVYGKKELAMAQQQFLNFILDDKKKNEFVSLFSKTQKIYNIDTVGYSEKTTLIDQHASTINLKTNVLKLSEQEIPYSRDYELVVGNDKAQKIYFDNSLTSNTLVTKSNGKTEIVTKFEPKFKEVKYEFRDVTFKTTKKIADNHELSIYIIADLINNIENSLSYKKNFRKNIFKTQFVTFKMAIAEPTFGIIKTKKDSFKIWLEPGQNYTFSELENQLKINGSVSNSFNFLKKYNATNLKIQKEMQPKLAGNKADFVAFLKEKKVEKNQLLETFLQKNSLSESFQEVIKLDNEYWVANCLFEYGKKISTEEVEKTKFYDFLNEVKIQNENALQSIEYQLFVHNFVKLKAAEYKDIALENIAQNVLSGKVLKYWEAYYLILQMNTTPIDSRLVQNIQKYADNSSYPSLEESVKNSYQSKALKVEGKSFPSIVFLNREGKTLQLKKSKDNFMLYHFWSLKNKNYETEMRNLDKLVEEYKDKNLKIIFVNTEKNFEIWKKITRKANHKNEQYFATTKNIYEANIVDFYNSDAESINVLVNQNGEIVKKFGFYNTPLREILIDLKNILVSK